MNEPLTNSHPGISFSGKTHNNHPQWHNQPLRLSKEEKRDPLPVLDDFFECYHLNDVRQILWDWLSEVISSQRSIAADPLERNNHMYFYEKIERIIEAAYVMKKRIHKHRRRKEKRRLKNNTESEKNNSANVLEHANSATVSPAVDTVELADQFNKPKQLLEFAEKTPMYVIAEVFKSESLAFLRDQLRDWLHIAVSADSTIYDDGEQRRQLLSFHDQLQILIEALFVTSSQLSENPKTEKQIVEIDKPRLLCQDQIANPKQVITGFFEKFPMVYIIRELNDWVEASLCFAGPYPENMDKLQAFYTYRNVLCLISAANRL